MILSKQGKITKNTECRKKGRDSLNDNDKKDAVNNVDSTNGRTNAVKRNSAINERTYAVNNRTDTDYTDAVYLCKRCELAIRSANRYMKRIDIGHESAVRRCAVCERYDYCGRFRITDRIDRRQKVTQ